MMHHRRAASDTAMFNRPLATDLKKEGTSSSHSSRSTTPLMSLLARPTGMLICVRSVIGKVSLKTQLHVQCKYSFENCNVTTPHDMYSSPSTAFW